MKIYIIIIITFLSHLVLDVLGQTEFVSNGNFESGNVTMFSNNFNNNVTSWYSVADTTDIFDTTSVNDHLQWGYGGYLATSSSTRLHPHSGKRFAGLINDDSHLFNNKHGIIATVLNSPLKRGYKYIFRCYANQDGAGDQSDANVRMWVGKSGESWDDAKFITPISGGGTNAGYHWTRDSIEFWVDDDYSVLYLGFPDVNHLVFSKKYYFHIDDVSIKDYCSVGKECSTTIGPMNVTSNNEHTTSIPLTFFGLTNVGYMKLEIKNVNSAILRTIEIYNPAGTISWDGLDNNGNVIANQSLLYALYLSNDCSEENLNGTFIKNDDVTSSPNFNYNSTHKPPKNCCPYSPNMVIVNQDLDFDHIYKAVTSVETQGSVTVKQNVNVSFKAGQQITLNPGFSTETSSKFTAEIEGCAPGEFVMRVGNTQTSSVDETNEINKADIGQTKIEEITSVKENKTGAFKLNLNPNPNNGQFTINTNTDIILSITIKNIIGESIYRAMTTGANTSIDLSGFSKGIYFVTIKGEGINETQKIIIE